MGTFLKDELLELLKKARAGNATGDDYSRIAAIINGDHSGELIAEVELFLAQEEQGPAKHIEPYDHDYWQQAFLEIKETWQARGQKSEVSDQMSEGGDLKSEVRLPASGFRLLAFRRWWWAAASIIVLLSIGTYLLTKTRSPQRVAEVTKILPGKDGAILTLANGSQLLLDTIKNGIIALQGGTTARIVNDTLIYEGRGSEAVYNVISTPKARKFHLILPDGTKAWLNSASSVRYPTVFTGNERRVTVTGEVYFEVAKNKKMPFRLNVNNQAEIEVLGTHFNVKAYDNEPVINTTLLEGIVRVTRNAEHVTLHPGQQAQIIVGEQKMQVNGKQSKDSLAQKATGQKTSPGVKVINDTDIDKVMAWKNGVFDFNNIAFDDAMYQLERWYDIQVVYEKGIPTDIELSGKITKDVTLNDLVTILEKIGVKCRLEGRKLLIQS